MLEIASALDLKDLNVSLQSDLSHNLERYAELVGKSQSDIASEALDDYLSWRMPQIKALRQSIQEADAGEFASDAEVEAFFNRYRDESY